MRAVQMLLVRELRLFGREAIRYQVQDIKKIINPKIPNPLVLQLAGLAVPLPFRRRKHICVFWYKGQFHYIEFFGESQKGYAMI